MIDTRAEWLARGLVALAWGGDYRLAYLGAYGIAEALITWRSKNRSN